MEEIARTSVVYNVTMDDMVAFNEFHMRGSRTMRSIWRRCLVAFPLLAFVFSMALLWHGEMVSVWPALFTAAVCAAGAAGYVLLLKHLYAGRLRKSVRALYSEDQNPCALGEHTLEVDEEGFTVVSRYSRCRYAWGALVKVETEPRYSYIYLGAVNALVIPHGEIVSGDFRAVLEQIGRHYHPDKALAG